MLQWSTLATENSLKNSDVLEQFEIWIRIRLFDFFNKCVFAIVKKSKLLTSLIGCFVDTVYKEINYSHKAKIYY